MIGIIGGMGPMAGLDVHRKLIEATPANCDQDHLNIFHIALPGAIADRTTFLLEGGQNPASGMIAATKMLVAAGATHIIAACNTAHAPPIWRELTAYIQAEAPHVQLCSLVEAVCQELQRIAKPHTKVAILSTRGTYQLGIYQQPIRDAGIEVHELSMNQIQQVHQAIYHPKWGIKASKTQGYHRASAALKEVLADLENYHVSHAILACTELPLVLKTFKGLTLIDPAESLAHQLITLKKSI